MKDINMGNRFIPTIVLLSILLALLGQSDGKIAYTIDAKVGGSAFYISRETQNMTFSLDGIVSGSGNFSRFTDIIDIAGIKSNERSYAVRGGKISFDEQQRLQTVEGPVQITIYLKGSQEEISIPDESGNGQSSNTTLSESAEIEIDENWPAGYANYKKLTYNGPNMHSKEFYNNNGDVFTSSIDSWKLEKESLYRTSLNRTLINAFVYPTQVAVDTKMNRSSFYALSMNSLGLTHIGISRADTTNTPSKEMTKKKPDVWISEDYIGEHEINLKLNMADSIIRKREQDDYIPCCSGGYNDMRKTDLIGLSSDSVFNCSCANFLPVS
jgi:hypothetical protein